MPQSLPDTFHAIVDTVSCIMHYGFAILSDVSGHYNGIIGLKSQFLRNIWIITYCFSLNWQRGLQGLSSAKSHNSNLLPYSIQCRDNCAQTMPIVHQKNKKKQKNDRRGQPLMVYLRQSLSNSHTRMRTRGVLFFSTTDHPSTTNYIFLSIVV